MITMTPYQKASELFLFGDCQFFVRKQSDNPFILTIGGSTELKGALLPTICCPSSNFISLCLLPRISQGCL